MGESGTTDGSRCAEPVACTHYAGDDGPWLVDPDPDWPGVPSKPAGRGWIWCASAADILQRFSNMLPLGSGQRWWQVDRIHIELVAAAAETECYEAVHERLYHFGPDVGIWGLAALGTVRPGYRMCVDIEGRGGAWVRQIDPMPDVEETDDAAC